MRVALFLKSISALDGVYKYMYMLVASSAHHHPDEGAVERKHSEER